MGRPRARRAHVWGVRLRATSSHRSCGSWSKPRLAALSSVCSRCGSGYPKRDGVINPGCFRHSRPFHIGCPSGYLLGAVHTRRLGCNVAARASVCSPRAPVVRRRWLTRPLRANSSPAKQATSVGPSSAGWWPEAVNALRFKAIDGTNAHGRAQAASASRGEIHERNAAAVRLVPMPVRHGRAAHPGDSHCDCLGRTVPIAAAGCGSTSTQSAPVSTSR
jgi:hypothetical protein